MTSSPFPRGPVRFPLRSAAAIALTLLLPAAAPGQEAGGGDPGAAEGPVELRLQAERGETLVYRFETTSRVFPPPGLGAETRLHSVMRLSQTAREVGRDTLRYRARIEELSLEVAGSDSGMTQQLRPMVEASREHTEGATFDLAVTRKGRLVRLTLGVERRQVGSEQITQAIRQIGFTALPEGPVSPGDSWHEEYRTDASAFRLPVPGEVVTRSEITLRRLVREGDRRVALLRVESSFSFVPATGGEQAGGITLDGVSTEDVHFDLDRGRFLSASGTRELVMDFGSAAGQDRMTLELEIESEARLLEE